MAMLRFLSGMVYEHCMNDKPVHKHQLINLPICVVCGRVLLRSKNWHHYSKQPLFKIILLSKCNLF